MEGGEEEEEEEEEEEDLDDLMEKACNFGEQNNLLRYVHVHCKWIKVLIPRLISNRIGAGITAFLLLITRVPLLITIIFDSLAKCEDDEEEVDLMNRTAISDTCYGT